MAVFPQKPRSGQKVLQGLYNSVCQIIDYLPTLVVRGDNSSTSVTQTSNGTIVHASNNNSKLSQGKKYYGYHGISLEYDPYIGCTLTGGNYITVDYYEENEQGEEVELEYPLINCTLSGGRYIQITPEGVINYTGPSGGSGGEGYTYVGDGDLGSGHIFVDYSYTDPVICSNLVYIDNLLNYPISGDAIGSELHFAQIRDIKDGAGTKVDYHWNSTGNHDAEDGQLIKWIDGICVNLNVSGGTYITTKFHQGVGYGDYSSASIDCNLSGDYNWYPHTSGFIAIVPQYDVSQNITGGIISTNLHGDETTIHIDPTNGTISCMVDPGGTTIVASGLQYPDYFNLSADYYEAEDGPLSGGGVSFLLPVEKDKNICFYTDAGNYSAFGTFASSLGEDAERANLTNGTPYATSANGWVRLSVFDNGTHSGCCLKFTDNYTDGFGDYGWDHSTPLYRFHGFKALSGDQSTVFINNNTISANVWQYTGDNDYITVDNTNKKISFTGSIPNEGIGYIRYPILSADGNAIDGIGISFVLPVQKGKKFKFYTDAGNNVAYGTFSPVFGETGTVSSLVNDTYYTPDSNGWVRISVFDDGTHKGSCLRFYLNTDTKGMPLYKFHGYTTLSGDNSTVFINNGTVSANVWQYSGDNQYITVDNATKKISFTGTLGDGFKAPKYNLLNLGDNDAGIAASGMGTTYLVPVSSGSSIWYEGTATVAIWVPVEGSEVTTRQNVPTSSPGWTTTDDGYVRLTVMDDGTNPGGCLKLHVGANGVLPLHKYSSTLSGAAGIIVEDGGIRNMIQPGDGLTSSALMTTGANPVMTGIAFNLSSQFVTDLTTISGRLSATTNEDRILSSHNGTLSWEENNASQATWTSLTPSLLAVNNNNHTLSAATQSGGGGGSSSGIPWPNYANLHNNGNSISIQTDYTAGSNGGWLRVSYKGTPQQQGSEYCYSIMIDGNAVGMYTLNSALGMMGNTWILPIPPFSRFMVNFPTSNTYAYFDGSLYDSGDIQTLYNTLIGYCTNAQDACDQAQGRYEDARNYADDAQRDYEECIVNDPPNLYSIDWYWDKYWYARAYVNGDANEEISGTVQYAAEAQQYSTLASTEATRMINEGEDVLNRANDYALSASNCATSAANYIAAASGEADRCYNWYLSAANHYGVTPHAKTYPNND